MGGVGPLVDMAFRDLKVPRAVLLGAIAAAAYLISYARHRQSSFTLMDAMILICVMGITTAAALPLLGAADEAAKSSALQQNLRFLRGQIALYKLEHGGAPPVLFKGDLPQMTHATDAKGFPGPPGKAYPYGPYLPGGVPVNPVTGIAVVQPTGSFPPKAPTGVGGWLYHQASGRIVPDLAEYLGK